MKNSLFQTVYHSPYLHQKDYGQIATAHSRLEVEKGTILMKAGKTVRGYYLIESGLFRSFVHDYNSNGNDRFLLGGRYRYLAEQNSKRNGKR